MRLFIPWPALALALTALPFLMTELPAQEGSYGTLPIGVSAHTAAPDCGTRQPV